MRFRTGLIARATAAGLALTGMAAAAETVVVIPGRHTDRMGFNPLNLKMVDREFSVTYPDADAARSAEVEKQPVFQGKKWAFSARWDDNNQAHYRMRDLMKQYGYRGTFYLYSSGRFRDKSGRRHPNQMKLAKNLSGDGFSIGAHSMTHPQLTKLDPADAFYEIAAIRLELEAGTNRPVNSFTFPGNQYRSKDVPSAHRDIAEMLFRAGYLHNTNPGFVDEKAGVAHQAVATVNGIAPGDKNTSAAKFDQAIAAVEKSPERRLREPNLSLCTHVWMKGKDWDEMETGLRKYASRPDWWYCTESEYAAYRYQFFHSQLRKLRQEGNRVFYRLTLPAPEETGAEVPLSFRAPGAIAVSPGTLYRTGDGQSGFDLAPPAGARIPTAIDALTEEQGQVVSLASDLSRSLPGIDAVLNYDDANHELRLKVVNRGRTALENLRLRVGLPLAFPADDGTYALNPVPAGRSETYRLKLPLPVTEERYRRGRQFFFVQLDFSADRQPCRIYAATRKTITPKTDQRTVENKS